MGDLIDLIDFDDVPEPREHVVVQSNYLSKEKALNIAAWSGNVSASQILVNGGDKPFIDTPIPNNLNYPTIQDKDKEKDIKKEVKKEVQAEVTNDKIKFKIKDENESNEEDETGQLLVTDAEKPKDIKEPDPKPTEGPTAPNENNMKPAEPKDDIVQSPRNVLYRDFGIIDPESRVGRHIAAFHKQAEYHAIEELKGAHNYVRWTDKVLNAVPARCRKIIEDGETKCPVDDPEAVIVWDALNEYLYGYIYRSLGDGVALATIHPEKRSAYRLWESLYVRYGEAAAELERRELIAMLVRLRLTKANRQRAWEVRDIAARLAKAGYDLDDEQLKVMFHRGIPEYQRIEVTLIRAPLLEQDASNEVVERMLERVYSHLPEE